MYVCCVQKSSPSLGIYLPSGWQSLEKGNQVGGQHILYNYSAQVVMTLVQWNLWNQVISKDGFLFGGQKLSFLAFTSGSTVCILTLPSDCWNIHFVAKSKTSEGRRINTEDDSSSTPNKTTPIKKEKKSSGKKKKDGNGKIPAPEAIQPPPGPMVALGRPKDKNLKRPRSVEGVT